MALIGLGSPVPRVLPNPDGSFNSADDRYMLMFQYPIFAVVPPPTPSADGGAASGAGRPWPDRTVNILLPRRVLLDDEDVLMVLLDD